MLQVCDELGFKGRKSSGAVRRQRCCNLWKATWGPAGRDSAAQVTWTLGKWCLGLQHRAECMQRQACNGTPAPEASNVQYVRTILRKEPPFFKQ